MIVIKANGVTLPSPDEISTSDEIIWSANTGRSSTGKMIGDVIAEKKTIAVKWGVLTKSQLNTIRSNLQSGFQSFTLSIDGADTTITAYRSTLNAEVLGTAGSVTYYKSAEVTIIQQ